MGVPTLRVGDRAARRANLFGADFVYNLLVTALPFPVLLGIVAVIHWGCPWAQRKPLPDATTTGEGVRCPTR
jgi:hypothetical protein